MTSAEYSWEFDSFDGYDGAYDALHRNGEKVGTFIYNDVTDTCQWSYVGPEGAKHSEAWADGDMTPAQFEAIVREAYGD